MDQISMFIYTNYNQNSLIYLFKIKKKQTNKQWRFIVEINKTKKTTNKMWNISITQSSKIEEIIKMKRNYQCNWKYWEH